MLDGAARVDQVIQAAVADGQPAIAITDHGNMYGVPDFYKACNEAGIKPILGTEAYMAFESRTERPSRRGKIDDSGGDTAGGHKLYYHLTLLAENNTGYQNLIMLSSLAFLEGYYYKPRLDWELLETYSDGLIATTGCLGGVVLQDLIKGDVQGATEKAARLQDIFGRDNLFVEIQDHGIPEQHRTNPDLIRLARKIGAPLVATNDSHYTLQSDAVGHDALLCVQTGALMSDPSRFKFHGDQHYLKSATEMRHLFGEIPESCDSTLWIAERCHVDIEFGRSRLPEFPLPEGFAVADEYLRSETIAGAKKRWGAELPAEVMARLDYELDVISKMGFSDYFLIVADLIEYARDQKIRVGPGRGSAAGCAVSYCLRITDLDPIKYDLLFERFLNPGRSSMPDIDMDFDDRRRDDMIRYMARKYGRQNVAQIVTFSTIKARAAVRDAARVLGFPYGLGDKVAKAMPPVVMGRDTPLHACFEEVPKYRDGFTAAAELRAMYEADPDVKAVVDVAKTLEGLRRGDGIHAAAVVVTKEPLTNYVPIQRKPESGQDPDDAPVVTQYEMNNVEGLGLLKLDFLGLRNLAVIDMTLELIEKKYGVKLDIDNVPLDDQPTLEMLRRGDSVGVFQLEGGGMRTLMRSLAPTSFDDVAALVALYRPGPMAANMHNDFADRKNGRKPITYLHPDMEELLGDTYGLMIYQESVMRVAQKFAGYDLAEADNLRKACGKKIREMIVKERVKFVAGCEATGYGEKLGNQLFDIIEPFADYAFNKSHSFGYGLVSYQTAFLKANYPVEYFAALLTSVKSSQENAAVYLNECRQMGIAVRIPDVNVSEADYSSLDGDIVYGMAGVRNVGDGVVRLICEERRAGGDFKDFHDFCDRVDPVVLNKRGIESLIKAGTFDQLGHPRRGLLQVHEQIIDEAVKRRKERDMGVFTLFGELDGADSGFEERVAIPDLQFPERQRLSLEKEMLGLYVSGHPLLGSEQALRRRTDGTIAELRGRESKAVTIGGILTSVQRKNTRSGELMAICVLEDLQDSIEVLVFPRAMSEYAFALREDAVVLMRGRLSDDEEESKLFATEITPFEVSGGEAEPLRLQVQPHLVNDALVEQLKSLLLVHPGD
ncbi:MAG: DNA polymerase III subunit alpha, partial [Acidimicrobiales bacterium]